METVNIKELNDRIQKESAFVDIISMEMNKVIVGQKHLVENLLIGLLADGHILLEGMPGLAKTLAINTLANIVDAKFNRIQFTPDLLPSDITGINFFNMKKSERAQRGRFKALRSDQRAKRIASHISKPLCILCAADTKAIHDH